MISAVLAEVKQRFNAELRINMATITKLDIIEYLSDKYHLSKQDTKNVVENFFGRDPLIARIWSRCEIIRIW